MQDTTDTTSPIAAPADAQPSPAHRPQSLPFAGSARSTLGVEWELALIDRDSLDLRQCAEEILQKVGPDPHVHGEMMLNTIELVLSLIHISEPTRREWLSRMPSSA